jgi:DNA-directed RNA polymerase subunit H (RpoH/RPB5)
MPKKKKSPVSIFGPCRSKPAALECAGAPDGRLFEVYRFVLDMLDARKWKYPLFAFAENVQAFRQFISLQTSPLEENNIIPCLTLRCVTLHNADAVVVFGACGHHNRFNKDAARSVAKMIGANTAAAVLVLPSAPTSQAVGALRQFVPHVTVITHKQCWSRFPMHIQAPKHVRLTQEEVRQRFLSNDVHNLPHLNAETDPIVQYHGWKPGAVVAVHQHQPSGDIINYRIVK